MQFPWSLKAKRVFTIQIYDIYYLLVESESASEYTLI